MGMLNDTFKTAGAGNILSSYKGGFIVHMLRSLMYDPQTQDADFRAMMQDYVKRFTNHSVSTEDFQRLVEQHMKPAMDVDGNHRMDWFFREWVYGTDVPSYRLEYSVAAEKGGKPVVSGKLTQSGVSEGFRMRVPVFAELAGRKVLIGAMVMRGNSTADFKTALPEQPKRILLNINHEILTDREEVKLVK
jgi:aminopeptidase N